MPDAVARAQLANEIAHWSDACRALLDLEAVASPAAWGAVERYLSMRLRARLTQASNALVSEIGTIERNFAGGADVQLTRTALLDLRRRYLQVETVLDFFGDAVNTRTSPALAATLRGLDVLAFESIDRPLRQLGLEPPQVLVYVDKGLGASILRAGVRLWDGSSPSPVAAIKVTRHNLRHPTALFHETGHQFAHQSGWLTELGQLLETGLRSRSPELASVWRSWVSEVAADVFAFVTAGAAPLPALANVIDGTTPQVFRFNPFDPHPIAWMRVMLNGALCRSWYGPGPWDTTVRAWCDRHPPEQARGDARALIRYSVEALPLLIDLLTRAPTAAFRGRSVAALVDPMRVSPQALHSFRSTVGDALARSDHLRRTEPLTVFAALASGAASGNTLDTWIQALGATATPHAGAA